jgi:ribosomal protein S18 acetylase RimI-like enzyme
MAQLSPDAKPLSRSELETVLLCPTNHLFTATNREGTICGIVTLVVVPLLSGWRGHIDDVVVDSAARGMGIGRALVTTALEEAQQLGVVYVDMTSRPSRVAANALYERIGFVKRNTNVYRYAFQERTPTGGSPATR